MNQPHSILIVSDDHEQVAQVVETLRQSNGLQVHIAGSVREMLAALALQPFEIALVNCCLPDGDGLAAMDAITSIDPTLPVIITADQGQESLAVRALQRGATDYWLKASDSLVNLPALIQKALQENQLQRSIASSSEKIRYQALLLNNVRDAVVVWDLDGRITYWNPAAEDLFGLSANEQLGRSIHQVYLNIFDPPIRLLDPEQTTGQYIERQYQHPSGHTIWVSSRMAILRDAAAGNRLLGYIDVSHDISANKQAEQAVRQSEARYRAIVEDYQTELISRFSPNGDLTFVNEVFCRYFDLRREYLLTMNWHSFLPEAEQADMSAHLAAFSLQHPVATLEHQVLLPNGVVRWLQRTDRAIFDDQGVLFEFQSMGRDITARKEMEAQLKLAQTHLVQAARLATLGELAAGVAHQINNPLTTVIADARLLLRDLPPGHPGHESAEAIEQAGWRLLEVVKRLLEFSRPEVGTFQIISINETITQALQLIGAQINAQGLVIETWLDPGLPSVRGNLHQLIDVWVNLLLLARDASLNRPDFPIQVVSKPEPRGWIQVEVSDYGAPIPVDQLESVFEPNFVGSSSGRGTGLELSICREIIRQHGGEIVAECTPQDQTVIRVSLPPSPLGRGLG